MQQVNWGIIGLGNIAKKFAESFKNIKNANLIGVASKNKNKIEKFQKKYEIEKKYCFESYEKLIKCEKIDIIYIALPNSLHYEWIIKCIENNKKILVEKPATLNFAQIEKIRNNYNIDNIFFAEGFIYRYHPQISKVIEILNSNTIGKLLSIETVFGFDIVHKKNLFGFKKEKKLNEENRLFNKSLGGGVILDLGCYPVSLSTLIASLNSKINYKKFEIISKKKEMGSTDVEIDAEAEIVFDAAFKCKVAASFLKNLGKQTKIIGTDGELTLRDTWHAQPAQIDITGKKNQSIKLETNENIFFYEIKKISENILENKYKPDFPGVSIQDTFINMKILDNWKN